MLTFFWHTVALNHRPENTLMLFLSFFFFFLFFFLCWSSFFLQKLRLLTANSAGMQSTLLREHKLHSAPSRSQAGQMCAAGEAGGVDGRNSAVGNSVTQASGRRGSQRGQNKSSHSPAHSSDSAHSQHTHTHRGRNSRHHRK